MSKEVIKKEEARKAVVTLEETVNRFNEAIAAWQTDTGLQVNLGWNFKDGKPLKIMSVVAPIHLSAVDMEEVASKMTGTLGDIAKDTAEQ